LRQAAIVALDLTRLNFGKREQLWLRSLAREHLDDLPNSLLVLIDFLEIEQDLIAAAATASESQEEEEEYLEDLIPNLSDREKNDFLVRLLKGESHLGLQLVSRLRELSGKKEVGVNNDTSKRTLSELLKLAEGETTQRQEKEQEVLRQAKIQKLEALAKKKDKVWDSVFELITLKQSKPYDQAIAHLVDLRDLAEYQGKLEEFQANIKQMQTDYSNRPGLISRLQKVGLLAK
jgi:molybdopterin converting factor small subunit